MEANEKDGSLIGRLCVCVCVNRSIIFDSLRHSPTRLEVMTREILFEYSCEVSETKHWVSIFKIKTSNFWFSLLLSIHETPQAKQAPIKSKRLAPSHSQNSPPPPTLPCN